MGKLFWKHCGKEIEDDVEVCLNCGKRVKESNTYYYIEDEKKKKLEKRALKAKAIKNEMEAGCLIGASIPFLIIGGFIIWFLFFMWFQNKR